METDTGEPPIDAPEPVEPPPLRYREIFRFYLPLAMSWLLMAAELPITATVVSRSGHPEIQTAALQLIMGLALWIESPVIDLLATSTTLSLNRQHFAVISRFVWLLMGITAVAHAAIALTPLWGFVTMDVLGIPKPVADAAHLPMAILVPWSPFIGWRRYLQGVLIRAGRTRLVGLGTAVRVCTIAGVSLGLYASGKLTGMMVAAIALVCSVAAEAIFIHWASRPTVKERFGLDLPETGDRPDLSMGKLLRFHLPLTATTMTYMMSLPLTSAAIARSPDSVLAMAAWQVATSLAFLHRCVVFALPEPIIALYGGEATARKLARFSFGVGLAASASIPLFWAVGLDRLLFGSLYRAPAEIVGLASTAYVATVFVPLIGSVQGYLRGVLTAHHFTSARLSAVLASTVILLLLLFVGVRARWPGVLVAAAGLSGAALAELGVLAWGWARARRRQPVPAAR